MKNNIKFFQNVEETVITGYDGTPLNLTIAEANMFANQIQQTWQKSMMNKPLPHVLISTYKIKGLDFIFEKKDHEVQIKLYNKLWLKISNNDVQILLNYLQNPSEITYSKL